MELPAATGISKDEKTLNLSLDVPNTLPYFEGHFPGTPILPGVAMLTWAEQFAKQYFGITQPFVGADNLKFHHVVRPNTPLNLSLEYFIEKQFVEFSYTSTNSKHATGRIRFKP